MYNKKQIAISVIVGVLLFAIGGVLGMGVDSVLKKPQQKKAEAVSNLVSKVVSSIVAYGQVKSIDGRNITLSNLGDDLAILIANNAQVYSFTISSGKNGVSAPVQQTSKFGDIKVGDKVNVTMSLSPSGQLQGTSVVILPPPPK